MLVDPVQCLQGNDCLMGTNLFVAELIDSAMQKCRLADGDGDVACDVRLELWPATVVPRGRGVASQKPLICRKSSCNAKNKQHTSQRYYFFWLRYKLQYLEK